MILYSGQISILISIVSIIFVTSIYLHFYRKSYRTALILLVLAGFLLRCIMAAADPFLYDWDEHFHALVARNMIDHPFKPMLRVFPVLPYDMKLWCCNHIWVHKQPLFLWQMAVSMKLFGVNEFALRLPSALMGTISIYFIYDIARRWIKNLDVAFLAALLFAVSYYQLELTSGRLSLDHNDLAFAFYVTASIWAFVRYLHSSAKLKWAVMTGIFVGCAVLNKWLTGILIFGGWGLYELMNIKKWSDFRRFVPLTVSVITSLLVFVPWQLYILHAFPAESKIMYEYNVKHIHEALDGHQGSVWYHLEQMGPMFGEKLLIFIPFGIFVIFSERKIDRKLSISLNAMVLVILSFFSLYVQTKMPAFTYPVNSIFWIIIATAIVKALITFENAHKLSSFILILLIAFFTLKPWQIAENRSIADNSRNAKIQNAEIYKALDTEGELKNRIILNCKSFEDVEVMFYKNANAYNWYPEERVLDSLSAKGYKFAAFTSHNNQNLPEYIYNNPEIIKINKVLK